MHVIHYMHIILFVFKNIFLNFIGKRWNYIIEWIDRQNHALADWFKILALLIQMNKHLLNLGQQIVFKQYSNFVIEVANQSIT